MASKQYNIVFVGCHPDDEAIWCGGLLYELSRFSSIKTHVICLSGKDPTSQRESEFFQAKKIAGYASGIVLGLPLRKADEALPDVQDTLEEGLIHVGLSADRIDLLITHAPYGDEHLHPHHVQAHFGLKKWACKNNVPFGFVSTLPIPHVRHKNILLRTHRKDTFQILNVAKCRACPSPLFYIFDPLSWVVRTRPKYFLQFLTNGEIKKRMLGCYPSVDLKLFESGYAAFTNPCESIYLNDEEGMKPFLGIMKEMELTDSPVLFRGPVFLQKVSRRLRQLFS